MNTSPPSAQKGVLPRRVVLDLVLARQAFPTRRFAAAADQAGLEGRDRSLAREMLAGVIRRRRTLDAVFRPYSSRRTVEPRVLWTLRLALYQRFFLEHVPVYAAYASTLEAARPRLDRALGYANAVLRAVERGVQEEEPACRTPDPARLVVGERSFVFDRPLFPDPASDPAGHHAVALSYPDWLVQRWLAEVGEERTLARLEAGNRPLPTVLWVNPLRATPEQVRETLDAAGHPVQALAEDPHGLVLTSPSSDVRALPGYTEGWWRVQDPSARAAVALAAPRPGERILDVCAAPGGKAFAAWELTGGEARVVACDVSQERLETLEADRRRLGHELVVQPISPGGKGVPEGEWDLILMDVPCTNTGVLARRAEARWRCSPEALASCVSAQKRITKWVLPRHLGPRTRVLWTTCSLEPEEDVQAAARAARRGGLRLAEARLFEPGPDRGGGFAALLVPE